jgi:argininosuccinate synthase
MLCKTYYDNIIKYLIYGNVLKNNTYPLSVSAERLSQALHIAEHAKKFECKSRGAWQYRCRQRPG